MFDNLAVWHSVLVLCDHKNTPQETQFPRNCKAFGLKSRFPTITVINGSPFSAGSCPKYFPRKESGKDSSGSTNSPLGGGVGVGVGWGKNLVSILGLLCEMARCACPNVFSVAANGLAAGLGAAKTCLLPAKSTGALGCGGGVIAFIGL